MTFIGKIPQADFSTVKTEFNLAGQNIRQRVYCREMSVTEVGAMFGRKSVMKVITALGIAAALCAGCGGAPKPAPAETAPATSETTGTAAEAEASTQTDPSASAVPDTDETQVMEGNAAGEPSSVVALSKSVGEMWLLAGGNLSGITEDGLDLENIGDAVSVGSLSKPSLEAVLALEPDLVLLTGDLPSHKAMADSLEEQSITVDRLTISSFADYASYMKEFTGLTGRSDLYEENVTKVQEAIDAVLKTKDPALAGKTYLELRVSATKNKVLKNDYFASEIFNNLGLTNAADDNSGLDDLSMEAILAADPDYIFVIPQGKQTEAQQAFEDGFSSDPAWRSLRAVADGHVYVMPKDLFQYKPNARCAEAYQTAANILAGKQDAEF